MSILCTAFKRVGSAALPGLSSVPGTTLAPRSLPVDYFTPVVAAAQAKPIVAGLVFQGALLRQE